MKVSFTGVQYTSLYTCGKYVIYFNLHFKLLLI